MFSFRNAVLVLAKKLLGVLRVPWSLSPHKARHGRNSNQHAGQPAANRTGNGPIEALGDKLGNKHLAIRIPRRPPRWPRTPLSTSPAKGRRPCAAHGSSGAWQRLRWRVNDLASLPWCMCWAGHRFFEEQYLQRSRCSMIVEAHQTMLCPLLVSVKTPSPRVLFSTRGEFQ